MSGAQSVHHWMDNPKLSNDDVRRIRELRFEGKRPTELAAQFGVSYHYIHTLVTGQARFYAGGPIVGRHQPRPERPRSCDGPQPITWRAAS